MTATETLKKQEIHQVNIGGIVYEMVKFNQAEKAMKEYAIDKCKEQRENCYQNSMAVIYTSESLEPVEAIGAIVDHLSVVSAPEPIFD